jgi:hypothetical protein
MYIHLKGKLIEELSELDLLNSTNIYLTVDLEPIQALFTVYPYPDAVKLKKFSYPIFETDTLKNMTYRSKLLALHDISRIMQATGVKLKVKEMGVRVNASLYAVLRIDDDVEKTLYQFFTICHRPPSFLEIFEVPLIFAPPSSVPVQYELSKRLPPDIEVFGSLNNLTESYGEKEATNIKTLSEPGAREVKSLGERSSHVLEPLSI